MVLLLFDEPSNNDIQSNFNVDIFNQIGLISKMRNQLEIQDVIYPHHSSYCLPSAQVLMACTALLCLNPELSIFEEAVRDWRIAGLLKSQDDQSLIVVLY